MKNPKINASVTVPVFGMTHELSSAMDDMRFLGILPEDYKFARNHDLRDVSRVINKKDLVHMDRELNECAMQQEMFKNIAEVSNRMANCWEELDTQKAIDEALAQKFEEMSGVTMSGDAGPYAMPFVGDPILRRAPMGPPTKKKRSH